MAYPSHRTLIACSVSALALALVTYYYWQLKKRRKFSGAEKSDAPTLSTSHAEPIVNDLREDSTDSPCEESSIPLLACLPPESALISSATLDEALSVSEETTLETDGNLLFASDCQLDSPDNGDDIRECIVAASTEPLQKPAVIVEQLDSQQTSKSVDELSAIRTEIETAPIFDSLSKLLEGNPNTEHSASPTTAEEERESTMHLKSSDNQASSIACPTANGGDDSVVLVVGKMKQHLSISEETAATPTHLKVSSIEFESESKSTSNNSIVTIEAVGACSIGADAGHVGAAADTHQQSSSDEADKGNCEPSLPQETTDDSGSADKAPIIINSNEIENDGDCSKPNITSSPDSGTGSIVPAEVDKQSHHPQTSPAARVVPAAKSSKPAAAKSNLSSVKLSQTFAQVLSASKNTNSKPTKTMTTESPKGTPKSAPKTARQTAPATSYAAVAQEGKEVSGTDAYPNFPDATVSQVSLSEGQCSPNSEYSDVQSLGSSDSGKGSSEILHADSTSNGDQSTSTPYHIVNSTEEQLIGYQFELPHYLCGKLIGASGHFINSCKQRSGTQIVVSPHFNYNSENKICSITGAKANVSHALNLIRRRFPLNDYPHVTLQQINLVNPINTIPLNQACQLNLPPDIITDVILSCTVSAGHFFLQQPTHPSYPQLNQLDHCMKVHYSEGSAPQMPQVYPGILCAAPAEEGWFRALIKTVHESKSECDIMFVDYGGYVYNVPISTLRQIRYDFLSLPFQASECYLANVMPADADNDWIPEANALFDELAQGLIYASIIGYAENGIPLVNLFKVQDSNRIFINKELVDSGHGQWVTAEATPACQ